MRNKLTYSLNYRKPKDQYSDTDELMVCIRYYHRDHKWNNFPNAKPKIIKKSTGVKCRLGDWDEDWHNNTLRLPIKPTDPNYIEKNNILKERVQTFKDLHYDSISNNDFSNNLFSNDPISPLEKKWEILPFF
jgi:hypothetical protein